ncbi:MAG TPA: GTP-binding protein, partial [Coleofasciculaceae cyanobacterium]
LPKPLVQAFRWPEIRTGATVDGVIATVDCEALAAGRVVGDLAALTAQRAADDSLEHETPIEELFEDQLACADLVLLTKCDRVEAAAIERVETWLKQELRPGVKIVRCQQGAIAPELLLGFNAAVEDNLDDRPSHHDHHHHDDHDDDDHDHDHDHDHDDDISAIALTLGDVEPRALVQRLERLVQEWEIYRIKGFASVASKPMRLVVQGVGPRFDTFFDRAWRADEDRSTRLVIIGRDLDRSAIEAAIA